MHPFFQQADAEHRRISQEAEARFAALTGGGSVSELPPSYTAPARAPEAVSAPVAPRIPSAAEREAQRVANFARLSEKDQQLLAQFGAAPG